MRNGFLLVVLVWLGWTAGVQLSTVNVINYAMAPFNHFDIGFYLAEPLMVIVAAYTLLSVVLIGRGVFCGWLCPFGALQELLAQVSRALRVPQWNPPAALEQRLWWGKYIAAAVVLILVISAVDPSGASLEIEPFKTAITSKFTRAWPYVLYAVALLGSGSFPSALIADSSVRSAASSPLSTGCISSTCSSAVRNAAIPAISASAHARCGRSRRPAGSSPPNASSASIARSNTTTTSAARRWCRQRSSGAR